MNCGLAPPRHESWLGPTHRAHNSHIPRFGDCSQLSCINFCYNQQDRGRRAYIDFRPVLQNQHNVKNAKSVMTVFRAGSAALHTTPQFASQAPGRPANRFHFNLMRNPGPGYRAPGWCPATPSKIGWSDRGVHRPIRYPLTTSIRACSSSVLNVADQSPAMSARIFVLARRLKSALIWSKESGNGNRVGGIWVGSARARPGLATDKTGVETRKGRA
jgi:hypothetical protein